MKYEDKMTTHETSMNSEINCTLKKIVFFDENNKYGVIRAERNGVKNDSITITGTFINPVVGQKISGHGTWSDHPKFGKQLLISEYSELRPTENTEIVTYLSSGVIKGIGKLTAEIIVKEFGSATFDVLDNSPEQLIKISGIGKKKLEKIICSWTENKNSRIIVAFFAQYGISVNVCLKIYSHYKEKSIERVKENPYILAKDIWGIGFKKADEVAIKLGVPMNSPLRINAAIVYTIQTLSNNGHTRYPYYETLPLIQENIGDISLVDIAKRIQGLLLSGDDSPIILEDKAGTLLCEITPGEIYVSYKSIYNAEKSIAINIKRLISAGKKSEISNIDRVVTNIENQMGLSFAPQQFDAIKMTMIEKFSVITGGPGTGKTTIAKAVITYFLQKKMKLMLVAPTGKAAKRLEESTGQPASTIHRLLKFTGKSFGFDQDNKLEVDALIIDESSMIDTFLMKALIQSVPTSAIVVMLGDINQLPSIGAGNILKDIIESGKVAVTMLTEVYRQAQNSGIVMSAHKVNAGKSPIDKYSDYQFIESSSPEETVKRISALISVGLKRHYSWFDPFTHCQILSPLYKGITGINNLNIRIQATLNANFNPLHTVIRNNWQYRVRDKVIQTKNNYKKDVFNGDTGVVVKIDKEDAFMEVSFDGNIIEYGFTELNELSPAYATSIHKSQGSEYPVVIIPIDYGHFVMLQRNLIYTAITRAKQMCIVIGDPKALNTAVKNDNIAKRHTGLIHKL